MKRIALVIFVGSLVLNACGTRPDSTGTDSNVAVTLGPDGNVITGDTPDLGLGQASTMTVRATSNDGFLETGGSTVPVTATITALVTNASNQALAGEAIEFSSSGGVLEGISEETDENGRATATLSINGEYENKTITVTVVSGTATDTVLIETGGSSIEFKGASQLALGGTSDLTVTLTAGDGEPIPNEEITFSSAASNTITPATATTDSNGRVSIVFDSANGTDTITASALNGLLQDFQISVNPDLLDFVGTDNDSEFPVGTTSSVTVAWESGNAPVANQLLTFGITAGQIVGSSSVMTAANGRATIQILSSSAGPATLTVDAADGPSNRVDVEFVATTPALAYVSTSSTRVHTNDNDAETTNDEAVITALVTDANGNPVKNQEVVFFSGDPNADLRGGQLNPATAITDSQGKATTIFSAGQQPTQFEEILITGLVSGTTIDSDTRLTVVERRLNTTLGTSGLLEVLATGIQYGMPFAVQVADGGGSPIENAFVDISITPKVYKKGYYELRRDLDDNLFWHQEITVTCDTEDGNGNRVLDIGEDINGNGVLDPQDPASIAAHTTETPTVVNGTITTDANGFGYFTMVYPASSSQWSEVDIYARASGLSVEADEVFDTGLPVLAERVDDENDSPPNSESPYGRSTSCADEE